LCHLTTGGRRSRKIIKEYINKTLENSTGPGEISLGTFFWHNKNQLKVKFPIHIFYD